MSIIVYDAKYECWGRSNTVYFFQKNKKQIGDKNGG
tara:strand:+ start:81 stop:188 length:108 start_codon:yes stop_codon:yes gene_type:complete